MVKFGRFFTELPTRDKSNFWLPGDNWSKYQRIVETIFWIANGQILSLFVFDRVISQQHPYFCLTIT